MFRYVIVYVLVAVVVYINAEVIPYIECGPNEEPSICGEGLCPPTCSNRGNVKLCQQRIGVGPVCRWEETGGCRCIKGTVRNENNNCVPLSECPSTPSKPCPLE
ncbi:uncharacterized protein LOC116414779 [Apis florea]|uniref:uncharacterized protein LOC116414779 n=1 Tax=Apis florea TaxID=7463 RepID=UPI0012FEC26B|nr:uncharacterized protein LOC116414779 [Apis florea]